MLIDESGDMGKGSGSSKAFTMTAMVTTHPERLTTIAESYEKNTKGRGDNDELKYSSSIDFVRINVLNDIVATSPDAIQAVVLNKSDFPVGHGGKRVYVDTAETLVRMVLNKSHGDVRIVFDGHTALGNEGGRMICDKVNDKRIIGCETVRSLDFLPMQAHDFVAGSIGSRFSRCKEDIGYREEFYDIIRTISSITVLKPEK